VRRTAAIVVVALLAGCAGGDDSDAGVVDRSRDLPADVQSFLDRVADPTGLAFRATYAVLNKNGGEEHILEVVSDPPVLTLEVDGTRVRADDDVTLSSFGIFSGFLAENPAAAIEAAARRADAGDAVFSSVELAGTHLDCITIPVQRVQASKACQTPDGVFGLVENPSVHYELTAYEPSR
jgi:hypothetical protein